MRFLALCLQFRRSVNCVLNVLYKEYVERGDGAENTLYICGKNALPLERSENFIRLCMRKWPFFSAILFCHSSLPFFSAWKQERNTDICNGCVGRSSTNEYNFKDRMNFRKIAYDAYDAYNAYDEASKNLTEHC